MYYIEIYCILLLTISEKKQPCKTNLKKKDINMGKSSGL